MTNCYFHEETEAVTRCTQCDKALCQQCHDPELDQYCFVCALEAKNRAIPVGRREDVKPKKNRDMTRYVSIIAWYELLGGIVGVLTTLFVGLSSGAFQHQVLTGLIVVFVLLYLLTMTAGVLLLRKEKYGTALSVGAQILQIPQFIINGTVFSFIAGLKLALQLTVNQGIHVKLDFGVFSFFQFYFGTNLPGLMISINVIPMMMIYVLYQAAKQQQLKNEALYREDISNENDHLHG
jgi:hypothetical protein